jgi:hypothetical protein
MSGSSAAKGKGKEDWIGWGVRGIAVSPLPSVAKRCQLPLAAWTGLTSRFRRLRLPFSTPLHSHSTIATSSSPRSSSPQPWNGD